MKNLLFLAFLVVIFVGCNENDPEPNPADVTPEEPTRYPYFTIKVDESKVAFGQLHYLFLHNESGQLVKSMDIRSAGTFVFDSLDQVSGPLVLTLVHHHDNKRDFDHVQTFYEVPSNSVFEFQEYENNTETNDTGELLGSASIIINEVPPNRGIEVSDRFYNVTQCPVDRSTNTYSCDLDLFTNTEKIIITSTGVADALPVHLVLDVLKSDSTYIIDWSDLVEFPITSTLKFPLAPSLFGSNWFKDNSSVEHGGFRTVYPNHDSYGYSRQEVTFGYPEDVTYADVFYLMDYNNYALIYSSKGDIPEDHEIMNAPFVEVTDTVIFDFQYNSSAEIQYWTSDNHGAYMEGDKKISFQWTIYAPDGPVFALDFPSEITEDLPELRTENIHEQSSQMILEGYSYDLRLERFLNSDYSRVEGVIISEIHH